MNEATQERGTIMAVMVVVVSTPGMLSVPSLQPPIWINVKNVSYSIAYKWSNLVLSDLFHLPPDNCMQETW